MSTSTAQDIRDLINNLIRGRGLVGQHTHRADDGGSIQTDMTIRHRNALVKPLDTDSQILNENLNAELWRGHQIFTGTTAPTLNVNNLALGDFWYDGAHLWVWQVSPLKKWVEVANITDITGAGAGTPHNLLDGVTHPDTLVGTVVRGDVIVGNATPKWARKALGGVGTFLRSDGTDLLYAALLAADIPNLPASIITSGILPIARGGTNLGAYTSGSVIFFDGTSLNQDNANLFWDNTNKRLGIGTSSPTMPFHVYTTSTAPDLAIFQLNGNMRTFLVIDSKAGEQAGFSLRDGGIEKFEFIKQKTNEFLIYDNVNAAIPLVIAPSAKSIQFDHDAVGYKVGIGTANPGAQLNVSSAIEIFQTAPLTAGSVGSLIAPYDTVTTETDAKGGNLNGAIVVNNADLKIYARTGGVWKGTAIAGFSIPNYKTQDPKEPDETICPLCHEQMKPKQALGMWADKWYNGKDSKDGLHAVAAHLKCLNKLDGD